MGNKKGFGGGEDVPSSQTFIQEEQLVERERAARRGEGVHSGALVRTGWSVMGMSESSQEVTVH